jgi:DNA-binding CsgD family transcriptional regulator
MLTITSAADAAAVRTIQFATDVLEGSGAAFYRVNSDMSLDNFALLEVPLEFHRQYLERMNRHDPLHVRHMTPTGRSVARLVEEMACADVADATAYRSFSSHFGIGDMVEFFFRRGDRIVAGMSVMWRDGSRIPENAMGMALKMHDYMEFNLLRDVGFGPASTSLGMTRYGLTAREQDVVELLCCGRTNREIGDCLQISLATVKTHLLHIFEKLGVENRSAVVALISRLH